MSRVDIRSTAAFKAQTTKAIFAIFLFLISYVAILLLTIGLAALCVYSAIQVLIFKPTFITLFLAIGLIAVGGFVFFFSIKFLFKSHKFDLSNLYEVTREMEPQLFELIDELAQEIGTKTPKNVYLASDVNASVFYDSSFWSMFFPVRKNLILGLGMVNSLTKAELKAVLAHELGHFSQRSMRVSSYVYYVNQVIHNMLYDNKSYEDMLIKWASLSGFFSPFIALTANFNRGTQWVIHRLYAVVNKEYLALSREMEFHADEVAARVVGYEHLKSSLPKLVFATYSFESLLKFYNDRIHDNIVSANLFKDHFYVLHFLARHNHMRIVDHFPDIGPQELNRLIMSKLVLDQQWDSHPSIADRVGRLEGDKFTVGLVESMPANDVFSDIEHVQKQFTQQMFSSINYDAELRVLDDASFQSLYVESFERYNYTKFYNGYYDLKNPTYFDVEGVELVDDSISAAALFATNQVDYLYEYFGLLKDHSVVRQIAKGHVNLKTFDYDGVKYIKEASAELADRLGLQLDEMDKAITAHDIRIFNFFRAQELARQEPPRLAELYRSFFALVDEFDERYGAGMDLFEELLFTERAAEFGAIAGFFTRIKPQEAELKAYLKELMQDEFYQPEITSSMRANWEAYLFQEWTYFEVDHYKGDELQMFLDALNDYLSVLSQGFYRRKRELLDYQEGLLS